MTWKPITNLPPSLESLENQALKAQKKIWDQQKHALESSGRLQPFLDKLAREWAIETGVIENIYQVDRGVTETLIEHGIQAAYIPHGSASLPAEELVAILQDHQEALEGVFEFVAGRRALTPSYIKELHAVLTRHQKTCSALDMFGAPVTLPLLRGEWKKQPNNPKRNGHVHEYCPPEQVPGEMEKLLSWHEDHDKKEISPEVQATWLHHRFTQIHPFQDGNGRVARALTSMVFIKKGFFPLSIHREQRPDYIAALEEADLGNLSPLVKLFSENQILLMRTGAHESPHES